MLLPSLPSPLLSLSSPMKEVPLSKPKAFPHLPIAQLAVLFIPFVAITMIISLITFAIVFIADIVIVFHTVGMAACIVVEMIAASFLSIDIQRLSTLLLLRGVEVSALRRLGRCVAVDFKLGGTQENGGKFTLFLSDNGHWKTFPPLAPLYFQTTKKGEAGKRTEPTRACCYCCLHSEADKRDCHSQSHSQARWLIELHHRFAVAVVAAAPADTAAAPADTAADADAAAYDTVVVVFFFLIFFPFFFLLLLLSFRPSSLQ